MLQIDFKWDERKRCQKKVSGAFSILPTSLLFATRSARRGLPLEVEFR